MGTNYYWHDRPCGHCGRFEKIHVGKNSGGWSFLFRAWPHQLINVEHPDWGYDPESPFGFPVLSRVDWRQVFAKRQGELYNEYGERIKNPIFWVNQLAAPDTRQRAKEIQMLGVYSGMDPCDPEGFRFCAQEFS